MNLVHTHMPTLTSSMNAKIPRTNTEHTTLITLITIHARSQALFKVRQDIKKNV